MSIHAIRPHLSVLMVDHNVMRLHISVHDTLAVAEVQRLEQLQDIVPHIQIVELGVEDPKFGVVDVLEYQGRRLALYIERECVSQQGAQAPGEQGSGEY